MGASETEAATFTNDLPAAAVAASCCEMPRLLPVLFPALAWFVGGRALIAAEPAAMPLWAYGVTRPAEASMPENGRPGIQYGASWRESIENNRPDRLDSTYVELLHSTFDRR